MIAPSASYSFTIRLQIANRPGMLGRVASVIGAAGGDIGAVDLVETTRERTERDITVKCKDSVHAQQIVGRLKRAAGVRVVNLSDRTFLMHLGGKIEIRNKVPIIKRMGRDPIVFAMANPEPEIWPEEAERHVRVMATGRSDFPNQINNVLCFPGFFRGLLDARAQTVNDEMKLAAARALAGCVGRDELGAEYIIPSVFNKSVAPAVAAGVTRAAHETAAARRRRRLDLSGSR